MFLDRCYCRWPDSDRMRVGVRPVARLVDRLILYALRHDLEPRSLWRERAVFEAAQKWLHGPNRGFREIARR